MIDNSYKKNVSKLIKKAEHKNLTKTYSQFCKTKTAKKHQLSQEEINHYTSKIYRQI